MIPLDPKCLEILKVLIEAELPVSASLVRLLPSEKRFSNPKIEMSDGEIAYLSLSLLNAEVWVSSQCFFTSTSVSIK